ncbi:hypothetical protein [Desulfospira joergensenii]|uniref:hypothetical protein n=1 Tax=Desulfospira joergensenii TaxID=53329 RepID=UPI0003B38E8F|nr:hypothetical protein [Desulfospira joergensenii]
MKKIMIMGLGDVLKGDMGAGCAVLEKMAETVSGKDVDFAYLGCDTRFAAGYLLGVDLAVITGALDLSGRPGTLHIWDQAVFDRNLEWMAKCFPEIRGVALALAQTKLAEGFPGRLVFIWINPLHTETYGISNLVQGAVTRAVWRIHREIWHMRLSQAPCPARNASKEFKKYWYEN